MSLHNAHCTTLSPATLWNRYHMSELEGFRTVFSGSRFGCWKRKQILKEASNRCPGLPLSEKETAKKCFRNAIKLREKMRSKFPYPAGTVADRHETAIELLKQIIFFLSQKHTGDVRNGENLRATDQEQSIGDTVGQHDEPAVVTAMPQMDECSAFAETSTQETLDEGRLHSFLDYISEHIKAICSSWDLVIKGGLKLPSATTNAIWLFKTLSAELHQTQCTDATIFVTLNHEPRHLSISPFIKELERARIVNAQLVQLERNADTSYINMVINNAMQQRQVPIPPIHDLGVLLADMLENAWQPDQHFESFKASIYTLLLLRLREQWDTAQLSSQKASVASQCERLDQVISEPGVVQHLRELAESAWDITTIGCVSLFAEANFQRLLCGELGVPLVTVIAHLHISQCLQSDTYRPPPDLDRICERFAHLLFWDKKPRNLVACKASLANWVIDFKMRSTRRSTSKQGSAFFEERFRKRNRDPVIVSMVEILIEQKMPTAPQSGLDWKSRSNSRTISMLETDFRDFQALASLLVAIQKSTGTRRENLEGSAKLAYTQARLMLEDKGDAVLMTSVIKELEKFLASVP